MFTLLHMDESSFFRKNLSLEFAAKGYNYIGVDSIDKGKEVLNNHEVSIILTAVSFDEGDIFNFIKSLQFDEHKNIPIFILSGDRDTEKRHNIFELGIVDYILKSTPMPEIVTKIEDFVKNIDFIDELKNAKIAVLDDSKFERMKIDDIFTKHGITKVDYFETDNELLSSIDEYDIYLIDMILSHSSGEEVILKLRKKYQYAPILAVSAIENAKTITQVLLKGANDYIIKPYNSNLFLARIEIALRNYKIIKGLLNRDS